MHWHYKRQFSCWRKRESCVFWICVCALYRPVKPVWSVCDWTLVIIYQHLQIPVSLLYQLLCILRNRQPSFTVDTECRMARYGVGQWYLLVVIVHCLPFLDFHTMGVVTIRSDPFQCYANITALNILTWPRFLLVCLHCLFAGMFFSRGSVCVQNNCLQSIRMCKLKSRG
jgi:hypothetical protein